MSRVPILFLSDSPFAGSGLGRITRDLSTMLHRELGDKFKVGTLGRGGVGGHLPFAHYTIPSHLYGSRETSEWGSSVFQYVWNDFACGEEGVVFSIWDAGRLIWLTQPKYLQDGSDKEFLLNAPFERWTYCPVDGETDSGGLGLMAAHALKGYDRVLAYTPYGSKVLKNVLGSDVPWLPHMLDNIWYPRDRKASREFFSYPQDAFIVGTVATNQRRKDWGLAAQIGHQLKDALGDKFRQWWHIDQPVKDWNVMELCSEYGLENCTTITMPPQSDEWMAAAYSCCNVTLGIGSEGFGFPLAESQLCGTPVVHMDYGGGSSWVLPQNRIVPKAYFLDGLSNIKRPVFDPAEWAERAIAAAASKEVADLRPLHCTAVWPQWRSWFLEGLEGMNNG